MKRSSSAVLSKWFGNSWLCYSSRSSGSTEVDRGVRMMDRDQRVENTRETVGRRSASRRAFMAAVGGVAFAPLVNSWAWGQAPSAPALPLKNLGLEHLDIVVPDTAASARVYMRVFKAKLHEQPFQGSIRYFILLGDLPANRQVGYIAIGAAGNRPVSIGHYCALAERYDRAGIAKALEAAGYEAGQGGFGMLPDPDGIELQDRKS